MTAAIGSPIILPARKDPKMEKTRQNLEMRHRRNLGRLVRPYKKGMWVLLSTTNGLKIGVFEHWLPDRLHGQVYLTDPFGIGLERVVFPISHIRQARIRDIPPGRRMHVPDELLKALGYT